MQKPRSNNNWMILGYRVLLKNGQWKWPSKTTELTACVLEYGDQIMSIEPRIVNLKTKQTCTGGEYHPSYLWFPEKC